MVQQPGSCKRSGAFLCGVVSSTVRDKEGRGSRTVVIGRKTEKSRRVKHIDLSILYAGKHRQKKVSSTKVKVPSRYNTVQSRSKDKHQLLIWCERVTDTINKHSKNSMKEYVLSTIDVFLRQEEEGKVTNTKLKLQ